jgi:hypothetical protein
VLICAKVTRLAILDIHFIVVFLSSLNEPRDLNLCNEKV